MCILRFHARAGYLQAYETLLKEINVHPAASAPVPGFMLPDGCIDAAAENGRRSSNVYQVNPWLWQFGRCKPRLGGLTV